MQTKTITAILFITLSLFIFCQNGYAKKKIKYGWLEKAKLYPHETILTAKLDTGAKTASLFAKNIKHFQKHGEPWVSFDVPISGQKQSIHFKKRLYRTVKIKLRSFARNHFKKKYAVRPIVLMTICMNSTKKTIQVDLADRSRFLYPLLLGRHAIKKFRGNVNPNKKFLTQPNC